MRKFTIILLLILILYPIESTFGKTPPKFWIRSLEGERFNSSKVKSPYVISFFFVHCPPCIKEIPLLYKFMSTNYPNVPLLFIDPIKDDSKKDIQRFSEKLNVPPSYFYKDSSERYRRNSLKIKYLFLLLLVLGGMNISSDIML